MSIGVIGGTGLYAIEGLERVVEVEVDTPFGRPSDVVVQGALNGVSVCFLPRHGRGHRLLPSEINHKANIYALKKIGVRQVVSVSAVGSLREDLHPRDIVLPDQYFDRTKASDRHTFFGDGCVAHVSFGDPACAALRARIETAVRAALAESSESERPSLHVGGVYVNMEGPAFSTRAESEFHRRMGFDIVGMTSLAEARLCREAELCYQAMSMVTDFDCWRKDEGSVHMDIVISHLHANTAMARQVLEHLLPDFPETLPCACGASLAGAVCTASSAIPVETRRRLDLLIGKYLG